MSYKPGRVRVRFKTITTETEGLRHVNDRVCLICTRQDVKRGVVTEVLGYQLVYCSTCIRAAMHALVPT